MKLWIIVSCIAALFTAIYAISLMLKSKTWEQTSALILSNTIDEIYHSPNSAMTNNKNTHDYRLRIDYQYSVDGKQYDGNTIYAGIPSILDSQRDAEDLAEQFTLGTETHAYYNPNNPSQSALLLPTASGPKNWIILALAGLVVAVFISAGMLVISKM